MRTDDVLTDTPPPTCPIPPRNPRAKPPRRQIVFVDPEDNTSPWWWPAMVVPKDEFHTFKKSVNGQVTNPREGECVVVYFEDASFNIVRESDFKAFCPFRPPYTSYVDGKNGKAFCTDKAVILATLYWESGKIPPAFTWLQSCVFEDRSKVPRLHSDDAVAAAAAAAAIADGKREKSGENEEDGGGDAGKKRGSGAVSRRTSHTGLVRKDSMNKMGVTKGVEKQAGPKKAHATLASTKTNGSLKSSLPANSIAAATAITHAKPKQTAKTSQGQAHPTISRLGTKRARDPLPPSTTYPSLSTCSKCNQPNPNKSRKTTAATPLRAMVVPIANETGIVPLALCQSCRRLLDECLPAPHIVEEDEEGGWRPEPRDLKFLRRVLPESNRDKLVRHYQALQQTLTAAHPSPSIPALAPAPLLPTTTTPTSPPPTSQPSNPNLSLPALPPAPSPTSPITTDVQQSQPHSSPSPLPPIEQQNGQASVIDAIPPPPPPPLESEVETEVAPQPMEVDVAP